MRRRSVTPRHRRMAAIISILVIVVPAASSSTGATSPDPTTEPAPSPSAPAVTSIGGTIVWNATTTMRVSPDYSDVWTVSGTMVLVADDDHDRFTVRPGVSTYAYDFEHVGCSPPTHQAGTLETSVQSVPDDGVAQATIAGAVGEDLEISVFFDDAWMVSCAGLSTLESVLPEAFPGCSDVPGDISATLDASGIYAISCDLALDYGVGSGVTGHVEGTLSLGATPSSGPSV